MSTAQEKMDALAIWVAMSIFNVTMCLLGTTIWGVVDSINSGFHISGDIGMAGLHAVQPVPMIYYGFFVVLEFAIVLRTVFVIWSKTTYTQGY
jgi:hypothetical protein